MNFFFSYRKRGESELKPCKSVDKNKSREYLVKYVLPAIKARWPESDSWNTIYIEQDNAVDGILGWCGNHLTRLTQI
jgi:hypothetical protein